MRKYLKMTFHIGMKSCIFWSTESKICLPHFSHSKKKTYALVFCFKVEIVFSGRKIVFVTEKLPVFKSAKLCLVETIIAGIIFTGKTPKIWLIL